jgi:protein TonB
MFDSIRQDSGLNPVACFSSLIASLFVHAAVAGILVVVPLFLIKGFPTIEPMALVFTLPKIDIPEIMLPPVSTGLPSSGLQGEGVPVIIREVPPDGWTMPEQIPDTLPPPSDELPLFVGVPDLSGNGGGGGVGPSGLVPGVIRQLLPANAAEMQAPKVPPKKMPIRVGILKPSQLIYRVNPAYPELASRIHVSGVVCLEAIIDEEGNVTDITVLSGHPLLRDAAVEAVKQWKYTPTVQNGEPAPILASIQIAFRLR